uniref:FAS1 domain-containing protein n=1 Tax=Fusarium oxysporum (strain Fo5176) TaxID=660025 RepID=A0A0D2XL60_FUSOF
MARASSPPNGGNFLQLRSSEALKQLFPCFMNLSFLYAHNIELIFVMTKFQNFLPLAFTKLATAQNGRSSNSSLTDVLASNNHIFSVLNASMLASDPRTFEAGLSYRVLNGTYFSKNFTETPLFIETMLQNSTFENVTGGQVVKARKNEDAGLKFTSGVVHILNCVLEIPMNLSGTAIAANLTAVLGPIYAAHLTDDLIGMQNITVFAPSNGAFTVIASVAGNLSDNDLQNILQYHIVQGTVGSSTTLENGTLRTVQGSDLNISVDSSAIYIDDARVTLPYVLISNGVVHVVEK